MTATSPVTIADSDEGPLISGDQFGRFTALAAPVEARGRRLVLVSSTQVDSVLPTVPDSRDALQVDNDGESGHGEQQDSDSQKAGRRMSLM